jgi:deferrochelatase/peroxidase EfeB
MASAFVSDRGLAPSLDAKDVQGLVRFGYGGLKEACYLLLRIRDGAAARAWCATAPVATAEFQEKPPDVALQVAFTSNGLRALGLSSQVLSGFSAEFQVGMAAEDSRSRRLGDISQNAPTRWAWGRPGNEPDVLVILFAKTGLLSDWKSQVENSSFYAAFETLHCLPTANLDGYEPFGFKDGISQPQIDWSRQRTTSKDELTYTNIVALGEFLLGYPNEYGKYTDRPLLNPSERGAGDLLPAEEYPGKKDLGRNGTYLVMRQLEQDVRGFWRFLDGASKSNETERLRLGEAMVGRTTEGKPLVPLSSNVIPGIEENAEDSLNNFTYDSDTNGIRCPLGAHIRRANPRNVDIPGRPSWFVSRGLRMVGFGSKSFRADLMASTRFHRMLRRGREYGPGLTIHDALQPKPEGDPTRGIHFLCLNANISRQFEFVQNAWLMSTKFNGLSEESDPLIGNRAAVGECPYTGNFSLPRDGSPPQVLTGLPQFITVRGGAYFFLPSLRALRYFGKSPTESR